MRVVSSLAGACALSACSIHNGISLPSELAAGSETIAIVRDAEPPRMTQLSLGSAKAADYRFASAAHAKNLLDLGRTAGILRVSAGAARTTAAVDTADEKKLDRGAVALDVAADAVEALSKLGRAETEVTELSFGLSDGDRRYAVVCSSSVKTEEKLLSKDRHASLTCLIVSSASAAWSLRVSGANGDARGRIDALANASTRLELEGVGATSATSGNAHSVELGGFVVRRSGTALAAVELPASITGARAFVSKKFDPAERGVILASFAALVAVRWPGDEGYQPEN